MGIHRRLGCFNLVIERLLISGASCATSRSVQFLFQSRYRAASHFRSSSARILQQRLPAFQSRYRAASHFREVSLVYRGANPEFQSRYRAASHFRLSALRARMCFICSFNLVIERLLISGILKPRKTPSRIRVSISLSSGFSFQVRPRGAPDTLWLNARTSASVHFQRDDAC